MLSAALQSGDAAAVTSPKHATAVLSSPLDLDVFPCLRPCNVEGEGGAAGADGADGAPDAAAADKLAAELTAGLHIVGSSAPAPAAAGMADYAVHVQHRRDGKEAVPIYGSSLMGAQQLRGHSVSSSAAAFSFSGPGGVPAAAVGSFITSPPASFTAGSWRANFITQDVLRALPKAKVGDAAKARQLAASAQHASETPDVAASPALRRVSELNTSATAAGGDAASKRRLALSALKGSVVAFITSGYSGKKFCYERAKELGVRVIMLDGPDNWSQTLVAEGIVEHFEPIDFTDGATVVDRMQAALERLRDEMGGLDAVTTFNELAVSLVARLAERLGLPGNTPYACDTARDKHAARRVMEEAGLPSPKNALIEGLADVDAAAAHVGFPAVIKPLSAAASMGVVRVDSLEELREKVASTQALLASLMLDSEGNIIERDAGDEAAGEGERAFGSLTLLMEEFLDGEEVDVDIVLSNGRPTYGAVSDNWETVAPYFNETGSNSPSILSLKEQTELSELAVASLQALGFTLGVFHVELKATSRGPRLIEINARMGGGPVRDLNLAVWGVDLVTEHVLASCGLPAEPPVPRCPLLRLAENTINADRSGVVTGDGFMRRYEAEPDVVYARALVKAGDKAVCAADGMPTWLAEVCVRAPTVRDGIARVKAIEREVLASLPLDPVAA